MFNLIIGDMLAPICFRNDVSLLDIKRGRSSAFLYLSHGTCIYHPHSLTEPSLLTHILAIKVYYEFNQN